MGDRRRHARYQLCNAWEGALQLMEDVVVERSHEREIWVLAGSPARRDEVLTLDILGDGGSLLLTVKVIESEPVLVDTNVRHRIRLLVEAQPVELQNEPLTEARVQLNPR